MLTQKSFLSFQLLLRELSIAAPTVRYIYIYIYIYIHTYIYVDVESLQSCPTLCDPMDGSPSGSPIPGILQARTLEWVAISFSNAWKWKVKVKLLSRVRPSATPWTAAFQAPPSMGFSRQEYWKYIYVCVYVCVCISTYIYIVVFCMFAQLCLTLCNPMDCSLWGSSVHGILQARILECAAIPSSRGSS